MNVRPTRTARTHVLARVSKLTARTRPGRTHTGRTGPLCHLIGHFGANYNVTADILVLPETSRTIDNQNAGHYSTFLLSSSPPSCTAGRITHVKA